MQKADWCRISWGTCLKSKCPGSIPRNSDFGLGKAQESVCLQKLCCWFWCQVWKLGHPRSFICLVGVSGHEPISLILRPEHFLPCLRKCTFHSRPLITPTRALKSPSDAEPNMLNGMKCEGPPTPAKWAIKPTRQKICPDTASGSLRLQHNYSIIRKTT